MIVINNGVPKSGTTLVNHFLIKLFQNTLPVNGIEKWKSINRHLFLERITNDDLRHLKKFESQYGHLIIKTHQTNDVNFKRIIDDSQFKVICCYRDPRDIILSVLDHAVRSRRGLDKSGAFIKFYTLDDAADSVKKWLNIYFSLKNEKDILFIKYENLMVNKKGIFEKVMKFLEIPISSDETINTIYDELEKSKNKTWNYNKGSINRWKSEMNTEMKNRYTSYFLEELYKMGYKK
ncbi:MAG: sulfotransferase domain-containing protein [Bacteroidales bacterium]|nr:sulfotransferase domain-containing protein [Bacteroidales bacterium]